jgi:hypothetical protein
LRDQQNETGGIRFPLFRPTLALQTLGDRVTRTPGGCPISWIETRPARARLTRCADLSQLLDGKMAVAPSSLKFSKTGWTVFFPSKPAA